jgi:hypothetical protein
VRKRQRIAQAGRWFRHAFPGMDMGADTVRMLLKAVLAGTLAWALATGVFHSSYPTFAAFAAMLLMHMTIAESVEKAVHYTAAVLVGIGVVGAVAFPLGPRLWLLPVILLATMLIGRRHRLGSQGFNVAVAAIFAYGVFAMPDSGRSPAFLIRDLAGMVLLGAVIAVGVNLLIAPPLRYRSAANAVDTYCEAVTELLDDMVGGLEGGVPDADAAVEWRRRGDELPRLAGQARTTVDHAYETSKLNPRRMVGGRGITFVGYRVTVHAVERIGEQLRSVTAGLVRISKAADDPAAQPRSPHDEFLRRLAVVLSAVRGAVSAAAAIRTLDDLLRGDPLAAEVSDCRSALDALGRVTDRHGLDLPDQWAFYGALYTDAQRLCDEVDYARDGLRELVRALP